MKQDVSDDDKPIWGAKAIGEVLGTGPRKTYHLLESGQLGAAVAKVGTQYVSTKRRLREQIFGDDAGEIA